MPEFFIQQIETFELPAGDAEALKALKSGFPPRSVRRMSRLGLMLARCLRPIKPDETTPLVYTTTFTESNALERYLDSFPEASPLWFQSSIHPSGLEQAMILAQQPLQEFFPLAGKEGILHQALRTLATLPAERRILCGGEERGTWLTELDLASTRYFAFALVLSDEPEHAQGRLVWTPPSAAAETPASAREPALMLPEFFDALRDHTPLDANEHELGRVQLSWL